MLLQRFLLETGIGGGGVKPPKIREGVQISNFQGPLKLAPVYRDSIKETDNLGVKGPSFLGEGNVGVYKVQAYPKL